MSTKPKSLQSNVQAVGGGRSRAVKSPIPGLKRRRQPGSTGTAPKAKRAVSPPAQVVEWRPPDLDKLVASWTLDELPMLSVIMGTFNRLGKLQECVRSVRASVGPISYEIVITDGGSTDGSIAWMEAQKDIVLVQAGRLEGAVRAFNQAYRASKGHYVALINDDVIAIGDALLLAVARLKTDASIGQVACAWRSGKDPFTVATVYNQFYANLGVMPRSVADIIAKITGGLWSPVYFTYGADTELSAWVHRLGLSVCGLKSACFEDRPVRDTLRLRNETRARIDSRTFYRRWPTAHTLLPGGPFPHVTKRETKQLRKLMAQGLPGVSRS